MRRYACFWCILSYQWRKSRIFRQLSHNHLEAALLTLVRGEKETQLATRKRLGERKSLLAIGIIGLSLVLSVAFLANVVHAAASTSTTTTASSTNSTNSTSSAQPCTGLGTPQED